MMRAFGTLSLFVCAGGVAPGQNARPEFEAASIRPPTETSPTRCTGGPGTTDPGRLICDNFPLSWLVMMAYNVRPFQFSALSWMQATRFDTRATLPPNAKAEQFRLMLQHLLADRFKLALHFEKKDLDGYDLVVLKKNADLKPAAEDSTPSTDTGWLRPIGGPPVRAKAQFTARGQSMARLATFVSDRLGRPVVDGTGLSGGYDFVLRYTDGPPNPSVAPDEDSGLGIEDALKEQLGLSLVKKKVQIDVLVVDHAEKTPGEN